MTIKTDDGKIGIGSDNPLEKLEVVGNTQITDGRLKIFNTGSEGGEIQLSDNTGAVKWFIDDHPLGLRFRDATVAGSRLFIDSTNGNIGIGTTAPGAKLSVVGLVAYDDAATADAALSPGDFYQTSGAGTGVFATAGIVMVSQ